MHNLHQLTMHGNEHGQEGLVASAAPRGPGRRLWVGCTRMSCERFPPEIKSQTQGLPFSVVGLRRGSDAHLYCDYASSRARRTSNQQPMDSGQLLRKNGSRRQDMRAPVLHCRSVGRHGLFEMQPETLRHRRHRRSPPTDRRLDSTMTPDSPSSVCYFARVWNVRLWPVAGMLTV